MESSAFTILRNRSKGMLPFRKAARTVCAGLVRKTKRRLAKDAVDMKNLTLVFILRSAIAFLDAAVREFPEATVGIMGLKRDERTAVAHWYYENMPPVTKRGTIVIFDPMLATGGSAEETLKNLQRRGVDMRRVYFTCVIAAPEGIQRISQYMPRENIIAGAVDKGLDAKKYIVPGLGDFGDRYFGTL
jgi:uracil phosphoribosyltransferase